MSSLLTDVFYEANDANPQDALKTFNDDWSRSRWGLAYLSEVGLTLVAPDHSEAVHFASLVFNSERKSEVIETVARILSAANFGHKDGLKVQLLHGKCIRRFLRLDLVPERRL